ncbi:MAG TPA: CoA-binding protein, partial [Xanthobacteraceae bacterium]|nr:CoA-binding protein [Xanthobacteraceae bacterium]
MTSHEHSAALARLLRPRSVAIVGISPEPGSIGANALNNLLGIGFAGDIHLVSRSNREIGGRTCVGSIDELPEGVDAAVLAVPRAATVDAV